MKFVDSLPPDGRRTAPPVDLDALRQSPGRWAEIGRYTRDERAKANNRGQNLSRKHSDIEYTTRLVGDEIIVFARAVSA